MRKGKVFFHPIEGTGPLTITWSAGPKGDAVEARNGAGVGFFSKRGDLLCVIFDEVADVQDHQVLEFVGYRIEISVRNGKVTYIAQNSLSVKRVAKRPLKNHKISRRVKLKKVK